MGFSLLGKVSSVHSTWGAHRGDTNSLQQNLTSDWKLIRAAYPSVAKHNAPTQKRATSARNESSQLVSIVVPKLFVSKVRKLIRSRTFHFLDLSGELKNRIYEYVFTVSSDAHGLVRMVKFKRKSRTPSMLALLETCRQIKNEAEGLVFSTNHLDILAHHLGSADPTDNADEEKAGEFLNSISLSRVHSITKLQVSIFKETSFSTVFDELPFPANLRTL